MDRRGNKNASLNRSTADYRESLEGTTLEPIKVYKKDVLCEVHVKILDPFTGEKANIILTGIPSKKEDTIFVELYSPMEVTYFEKVNKTHIEDGWISEFKGKKDRAPKASVNNLPHDELVELVYAKYMRLRKIVNQMTSEAALLRIIQVAEEEERPEGTLNFLRERLSIVQSGELDADTSND